MSDLKLSVLINAIDKFTAPAQKIVGVSEQLATRLYDGQKALQELGRKGQAVQRMKALETRLGRSAAEMDKATGRTAALGRELAATTTPTRKLQGAFETARRKSDALKRQHKQQRDELRQLRRELRGAGIDTRKLGDAQRQIAGDIEAATRKMEKMAHLSEKVAVAKAKYEKELQSAANVSLVAGGLERVGRGALGMLSQPLAQMRSVERSKGELASLGIEKSGVDAITQRGRELSTLLAGVTTSAFVSAAYDIKSGIATLSDAGVADMTAMAALTAKATKAHVGQMTSLFATGYGAFKNSLYAEASDQEFGHILSASLAKSVQQFKTDGPKMQQAIQSMGSGLAESGIALADQFTALGMLQQKMEAGVAGTTLSALERSAGQAQARFRQMGIAIDTLDANGNLRTLPDLLTDMQQEFGDQYSTEIGGQIQKAFGSEEAVKFFKALWGQQDAFRANAQALEAAQQQGAAFTRTMARHMDSNMDARLQVLQQRWDVIKEKIGSALIPVLERLTPWLEKTADWIARFVDGNGAMTTALAGLAGGIGLIAVVAAPVLTAMASLAAAVAYFGYVAKTSTAATTMAALANSGGGKGWRGVAKKAGGFAKGRLGLLGAGIGALTVGSTLMDGQLSSGEKAATVTQDVGHIGGALGGAAAGAALGSVIPVVGTAIGGLIGSIAGSLGGGWLGEKVAGVFSSDDSENSPASRIAQAAHPVKTAAAATVLGPALAWSPAMADTPSAGAGNVQHNDNSTHSYQLTIQQLPGEDQQALTERIMREIERFNQQRGREMVGDGV